MAAPQQLSSQAPTPEKFTSPLPDLVTTPQSGPRVWLERVNFVGYSGPQQLLIDAQGRIAAIAPQAEAVDWSADQRVAFPGDYLSLPGLDLQINGALGLSYLDVQPDEEGTFRLGQTCEFLAKIGVAGFLPTLITAPVKTLQAGLQVFAGFLEKPNPGAKILGLHLEGPFLNPEKRGAHPQRHLLPLNIENVKRVFGDYGSIVKLITLAPELDPTETVIPYLVEQGITVSLGHSQATALQAQRAFDQGMSMLTHAFNAMPSLHHRQPGPLAAAITDPRVSYGLIADGQHVDPLMLELLIRTDRPGEKGTFLVSDALAPLGLGDGVYPWDERHITVQSGTARLPDGTLSGTTLGLLSGVQHLVKWGICHPDQAIALATEAPRNALNLPGLELGYAVNQLLTWSYDSGAKELAWEWFCLDRLV